MIPTRTRVLLGRFAPAALLALATFAAEARAQGYGPDPFRPYNSQYDAYVFGTAPGALDSVGNPTLNRAGIRNANQFQSFRDSLDGDNRYDRVNRNYDEAYKRVYRPNAKADARFDSQREEVSDLYFRYLREKDPKKRASLLKEYNRAQSRASRELSNSPNSRNARRPRSGGATPAPSLDGEKPTASPSTSPPPPMDDDPPARLPSSRSRRGSRSNPTGREADDRPSTPSEILDRATRASDPSIPPPPDL